MEKFLARPVPYQASPQLREYLQDQISRMQVLLNGAALRDEAETIGGNWVFNAITIKPLSETDSAVLVLESPIRDAAIYLKADTTNTVESANPFIRMEQDAAAVLGIIGLSGTDDVDGEGNTFTGMQNNGLAIHLDFSGSSIGLGTNNSVRFRIADTLAWFMGDNYELQFGVGADLAIYSDGVSARYRSAGAGHHRFFNAGSELFRIEPSRNLAWKPIHILESAAHSTVSAGFGQLWVKNTTPCELWFTDDAGNDFKIAPSSGGGGGATWDTV